MRCSNCGKQIPMEGKVCPWCHIDKTPDVLRETWIKVGAICGGIAGMFLAGIWEQWLWGVFWGAIIGCIAGAVHGNNLAQQYKEKQAAMQTLHENQRVADHAVIAHNAISRNGGAVLQNGGAFPQPPPVHAFPADPIPSSRDYEPIDLASITQQQEAAMLASGQYRECPHCAELIKANAKVCRFCQREVAVPIGMNR